MLPLRDPRIIEANLTKYLNNIESICSVSGCGEKVTSIYKTLEKRVLPLCENHYELISSEVLW